MDEMDAVSSVVVLSGGLDSLVSLALERAAHPGQSQALLHFNYGQRSAQQERAAVEAIAAHYGLSLQIIQLDWLKRFLPTGMQPKGETHSGLNGAVKAVWVPNRNGVLLNIAASVAEGLGANRVLFGANLEEAEAGFPDNGEPYWQRLNEALLLSTQNGVRVEAPVGGLRKAEIVAQALALNAPLELVWSCYETGEATEGKHCSVCASCKLLKAALEANSASSVAQMFLAERF